MKTNLIVFRLLILILIAFPVCGLIYGETSADSVIFQSPDSTKLVPDSAALTIMPSDKSSKSTTLVQELTQAPDVSGLISFPKIFWSVIFLVLGYFFLKIVIGILNLYAERKTQHKSVILRVIPIFKILVWSMVVYIILSGIISPPRETVIAFFASVGVAIGFSSQDLLKNLFGGLMILFDKPFQIGDKIEVGKYYGEVMEIGIRSTRIVTPDDSMVSVPNSEMMNQSISNANFSANNCQVVAEVYLPHLIDTKRVRQIATEVAQVSKYVYLNKPIKVLFFSDKTDEKPILKMRLKAYVMDLRDEFAFKSEMTEMVLSELKNDGLIQDNF